MRSRKAVAATLCVGLLALVLAACGSSETSTTASHSSAGALSSSGYKSPLTEPLECATKGGTLNVLDESDFEHLDPGVASPRSTTRSCTPHSGLCTRSSRTR